jgi:hypothetical protein
VPGRSCCRRLLIPGALLDLAFADALVTKTLEGAASARYRSIWRVGGSPRTSSRRAGFGERGVWRDGTMQVTVT